MSDVAVDTTQDNTEEVVDTKDVDVKDTEVVKEEVVESEVETKPEVKEFTLKLEEGSSLSDSDIDRISTLAKEKGLTEEEAKALVSGEEAAVSGYKNTQMQEVENIRASWVSDSKADKEFGGETFDANVEIAKTVITKYGSQEFAEALNETGFGNHPEVLRTFYRIGKAMANDSLITAESQVSGHKDTADVLYHTTVENKEN